MDDGRTNESDGLTRPMRRVQAKLERPLKDVLRELYVDRGMTLEEVGAELGRLADVQALSVSTVSRWMDRLGLDRRFPGRLAGAGATS